MNNEFLVGKIVTLKPLAKEYFQDYINMFSETVKKFLHVENSESEIKYLETRLEKIDNKTRLFYCIFLNDKEAFSGDKKESSVEQKNCGPDFRSAPEKLIGAIEIRDLTESDGQLYSWVNENYWGVGAYQEALALISQKYFQVCELCPDRFTKNPEARCQYYTANVDVENLRSYFALKKFGFLDAGVKNGPYGLQYKLIFLKK